MITSENRRVQMTKRLLKRALIELMQHTTLSKMTIKALCAKADVNRSTFYLHYADQFALLREVEQEAMDDALSALRNVDTTLTSLAYLEAFMGYIRENKAVFQVLLVNPEAQTFQTMFAQSISAQLSSRLRLTCPPNLEKHILTFLVQGCASIVRSWIEEGLMLSDAEIAKLLFSLSGAALTPYLG